MNPPAKTPSKADAWLFLPGLLWVAFTWLIPNHQAPWKSFHHEAWMVVSLVGMWLVVGWQTSWRVKIPNLAVAVLAMAAIPLLQSHWGVLASSSLAAVASLYLLAFFLAIVLGCSTRGEPSEIFWRLLFGALLCASLVNVMFQLVQWFRLYDANYLSFSGFWITRLNDNARPSGSLLQPNQLATVQVWGALALVWLWQKKQVRTGLMICALSCLLVGIALTQSRVAILELAALSLLAFLYPGKPAHRKLGGLFLASLLMLGVLTLLVPKLVGIVHGDVAQIRAMISGSGRLEIYRIFLFAIVQEPWAGYGLGNLGEAFLAAATVNPGWYWGGFAEQSHNLVLDFILWFGIPVGGTLLVYLSIQIKNAFKHSLLVEGGYVYFGMIAVFVIHSMVELPHQFLYFLVPLGLVFGYLLEPNQKLVMGLAKSKGYWIAGFALGGLLTAVVSVDYLKIQERYTEWRFESQRIGRTLGKFPDDTLLLRNFTEELAYYRVPPRAGLSEADVERLTQIAIAANTAPMYFDLAVNLALNGRRDAARDWMMRLNAVSSQQNWRILLQNWRREQRKHPQLNDMAWPPLPTTRR
jgi:O-antigen ligase